VFNFIAINSIGLDKLFLRSKRITDVLQQLPAAANLASRVSIVKSLCVSNYLILVITGMVWPTLLKSNIRAGHNLMEMLMKSQSLLM